MLKLSKKGGLGPFQDLIVAGLAIVVLSIVLGMGTIVLTEMNDTETVCGSADAVAIMEYGIDSLSLFASWQTTIVIVIIAAVVLGILVGYFVNRFGVDDEGM